jgi:anti-sigma B factor antagonist
VAELCVTTAIVGDEYVLSLSGDIDLSCSETIADLGIGTLESHVIRVLVLDMSAVTFIDSTGLAALVRMHNAASAQDKRLSVRNPSPSVWKVLRLCALDTVLTIDVPRDVVRGSGR